MCDGADLFLGILSILFPPIGVWVKRGLCSADSLINIALCCLGYLPGLIHSWYIISSYPDSYEQANQDDESRVAVIYVSSPGGSGHQRQGYGTISSQQQQQPKPQRQQQSGAAQNQGGSSPQDAQQGEGSGGAPPPSYADVVRGGDNKVQSP